MNIWRSYKQERDCLVTLVHFLRLLAVCWPGIQGQGHETIMFLLITFLIFIFFNSLYILEQVNGRLVGMLRTVENMV